MADPIQETTAVREAVHWLLRAERTLRTYPVDNEMSLRALREVAPRLCAVLPLDLELGARALRCHGAEVWQEPSPGSGIMGELYKDGIRRIRLDRGLDDDELRALLLALATPLNPDSQVEDYVTRLWEAQLPHVRISALDPYLDTGIGDDVLEGKGRPTGEIEDIEPEPELDVPPPPESAFLISDEQRSRVAEKVEAAAAGPRWGVFLDSLVGTLDTPTGARRAQEVARILESLFHVSLRNLDLTLAGNVMAQIATAAEANAELWEPVLERLTQADGLEPLHAAVEDGRCPATAAAEFLSGLAPGGVDAVCQFLETATRDASRRAYLDALAQMGPRVDAERVVESFRRSAGDVRRHYPRLLARLAGDEVTDALIEAVSDPELPVQREAVRALGGRREPEARDALLRIALEDDEPGCRVIALRGLGAGRTELDPGALLERIDSRAYAGLPDEEKDLLFLALAASGSEDVIPVLADRLQPGWNPFRSPQADWRRAASALARMDSPAARELLEDLCHSRRRGLADVCAAALQGARRGTR